MIDIDRVDRIEKGFIPLIDGAEAAEFTGVEREDQVVVLAVERALEHADARQEGQRFRRRVDADGNGGLAHLLQDMGEAQRGTDAVAIGMFVGQQSDTLCRPDEIHRRLHQARVNLVA